MKVVRKVLLYTLLAALVVVISAVASLFLFKDRIIREFIREANKGIGTPINIGKIDVSALQNFPNLAIVFTDVYVEDSHPGTYPLLKAKSVSFVLNPIEVWQKTYTVRGLVMRDSETNLRINKEGKNNYTIVKAGQGGSSVAFDLHNVKLHGSQVNYTDVSIGQRHAFYSKGLTASIVARDDLYRIEATGDITIQQIGVGRSVFLKDKTLNVKASLDYDDENKILQFLPSTLGLNKTRLEVSGSYGFKDRNIIDLYTLGKETDIQSLLEILPESASLPLKKYQSKGEVYFEMRLNGEISRSRSPRLTISFGLRDVTLFHPDYQSRMEHVNLEGSFETPSLSRFTGAVLSLQKMSGNLNGHPFTGNFSLENLDDPFVIADFHGELTANDFLNFFPLEGITEPTGTLKADVALSGRLAFLKNKATAQQVHTEGKVELNNLNFKLGPKKLAFRDLTGSLQFNNNDLAMSDLSGRFENSDFLLNGFFKNIVTYVLFENQPIGIEADLKSRFLDVDQLFAIGFSDSEKGPYIFSIAPTLNLNFNCRVDSLNFKKFHATKVKGDLLVKGQVAVSRSIKLNAMGGPIDLSVIVDAKNPKAIDLITSATLEGIHVDSLFYVFGNFRQTFIGHNHLKGRAHAFITMEATLNEGLRIFPETLVADVNVTIKNGELNNFEPLKKLSKYLDDEGLNRLRFADLKNDIHIEHKTVFIPQMEIRSNVTALEVSGTHTFDQKIDYRVVAPLRNKKKIDPDEAFGSIEQDLHGRSKIYLKITGTTDDYKVTYDQAAVRKKIGNDIKKEVEELRDLFRLKGKKKKKELELKKDDYFDWDHDLLD